MATLDFLFTVTQTFYIGLAKRYIRVFLQDVTEKPERTFWPTQHKMSGFCNILWRNPNQLFWPTQYYM